jgi:hypothetical protein
VTKNFQWIFVRFAVGLISATVLFFFGLHQAFAQSVTAPAGAGVENVLGELQTAVLAALFGALTWLTSHAIGYLPAAVRGVADSAVTKDALGWQELLRSVAENSMAHARMRLGISPSEIATREQKHDFLGWMLTFIDVHNQEILDEYRKLFAKSSKDPAVVEQRARLGVKQAMEAELAKVARSLPAEMAQAATDPNVQDVTLPKVPRQTVADSAAALAAKLAPRGVLQ